MLVLLIVKSSSVAMNEYIVLSVVRINPIMLSSEENFYTT